MKTHLLAMLENLRRKTFCYRGRDEHQLLCLFRMSMLPLLFLLGLRDKCSYIDVFWVQNLPRQCRVVLS